MTVLNISRPDDLHLHLRDGDALTSVVQDSARQFARAIIMPNLKPPVTTVQQALAYRERILNSLPEGAAFQPLMTLYLTDNTQVEEIDRVANTSEVQAIKYYPAGATTNSEFGVTNLENTYPVLARMEEISVPLLLHGEVVDADVDVFDREKVFIDRVLEPLLKRFPGLRIVFEHITTLDACDFVRQASDNIAATITPQHLLLNRNALFQGGIRPHHYCLPVLKREPHRQALLDVIKSRHPRFFLGTDSAPHAQKDKENDCGCAGIYSAHNAIELYASVFEELGELDALEGFASHYGADFYGMERNIDTITLKKQDWTIPDSLTFADERIVPFAAGTVCHWKLVSN